MNNIEIKNISKSYGNKTVLDNISLTIEEGKIYGLLGCNGAGKTTLLNAITNRTFIDKGEILINGQNIYENDNAISKVYYMTEKNLIPDDMKINDIFKYTKDFYPNFDIEYANILSNKFKLNTNKRIKELSTGYRSICKLITCLSSGANFLFFDEPVLGLDAKHRDMFYKELLSLYTEKQNTIIISTHIIEEISDLLERVIILNNSKIIENENVEDLLSRAYAVSGKDNLIDKYIVDKNVIAIDVLGSFKKATILQEKTKEDLNYIKELQLEVNKVELQKLFINLTDKEEI
ncbi:ABC transporter ATP-binding protein [Clostridium septicum]|uniref:ABC transporter ATP-binding protein n=1 Tax=Clostridium septicum TaxID=1504 RepID=A0A9N7PIH7_CLOSE|nr:ABC transporter ATP-binding protein [Clostridium septicum]AYE33735.1 multidrug ABC transporter ATP-binding protein [Clostridium septicum]QAS61892.1 ABC transporter ATP-binding protein [Clostridium septicum]UEC21653.1 ABC transporter ATP-binding protein [Clostridium septicum]USS00297.1 ABC transporter ATP-binding protein [Clostridium septicum]WLF68849.1 ABC transporter ATP-binding protein [Clostridium septicum]